jgi:hypothetical protein
MKPRSIVKMLAALGFLSGVFAVSGKAAGQELTPPQDELAPPPAGEDVAVAAPAAPSDAASPWIGQWKLNPELSDDAREKMREAMPEGYRGGGRGHGGGGFGPPGGHRGGGGAGGYGPPPGGGGGWHGGRGASDTSERERLFNPPAEITVTHLEPEISVVETEGRIRNLHPDGKKYKAEGGEAEVKTRWEGKALVVETSGERGGKVTETWTLDPEKRRLTILLRLERPSWPEVSLRRVYDAEAAPSSS